MDTKVCPVCDHPDVEMGWAPSAGRKAWYAVRCRQCGRFIITLEAIEGLAGHEQDDPLIRKRLKRFLHENEGIGTVMITSGRFSVDDLGGNIGIDLESASELYGNDGSPLDKYREALRRIAGRTETFGHVFNSIEDRWLIPTMDDREAHLIIDALAKEQYLAKHHGEQSDEAEWYISLTAEGLRYGQELDAGRTSAKPSATLALDANSGAPKLFLSHAHKDNAFAEKLAVDLARAGIQVWYDGWDLDIGHDLTVMIQKGIQESDLLAVVLSPAAVQSAWVEKEWTTALHRELEGRRVVVLPILYRDCERPPFLQGKVYADFRSSDQYEESLADLVRCLRGESKRPSVR